MADPDLAEVIRKAVAFDRLHLHTALPGRVVSYDPATQTAKVRLMVKHPAPVDGGDIEFEPMPELPDVPVAWFSGGGVSFQMPLQAGDFVEVIFEEADTGAWRESGQEAAPIDLERHGLSSCFALPVRRPSASPLRNVSGPHIEVPGSALTVGGDPASCKEVAIASDTKSQIESLASKVATAIGQITGTVVTTTAVATMQAHVVASVAATKLKAQ